MAGPRYIHSIRADHTTNYVCCASIRLFKLAYKLLPLAFIIWLRLEETEVTETHGRAITMVRHVSKDLA